MILLRNNLHQEKQKKSNDQRTSINRCYLIKDMKYYLVTRGLSSIAKLYNNSHYYMIQPKIKVLR